MNRWLRVLGVMAWLTFVVSLPIGSGSGQARAEAASTQPAQESEDARENPAAADEGEAEATPRAAPPKAGKPIIDPHVRVDREARFVEIDGKVNMRAGDWLELLACTPRGPTHEAVLTIDARPRDVHLALLLLDLEPGEPIQFRQTDDGFEAIPPTGPKLRVSLRYRDADGDVREVPANQWVFNRETDEVMAEDVWLFAGSQFKEYQGEEIYTADATGLVISLVNFGDDLLTRPTLTTNRTDNEIWAAKTEAIPPLGSPVLIRLKPVEEDQGNDEAATTQP